uniref:Uncharacterized protein n=1 Tax=Tanacetum cinerariifolium TaxID=118510 RepID=A0A699GWL5_TANCI|nr:hypothetical protein [Tanacetum cinerariifolium]
MDTTIEQQVAMDEALVPHAQRCPFFKAFLVTADVPEIYICRNSGLQPLVPGQSFNEPPFKEEILAFIWFLGHSVAIRTLTDSGALLPVELTNDEIRNSKAYKEYYAVATGEATPKPKASVRTTRSSSNTSITPPTAAASPRLTASTKGDDNEEKDDEGDEKDDGDDGKEGNGDDNDEDDDGEEGDDDDDQEVEKDDDKDDAEESGDDEEECGGDGEEDQGLNIGEEERHIKEEEVDELYRDFNINQGMGIQATLEVEDSHVNLPLVNPDGMESIFETTSQMDVQTPTSVAPLPITAPTMTSSTISTTTTTSQSPILPTTVPSDIIQNLPSFGSLFGFDNRLRTLEANFFEFTQKNQFAGAVSAILGIAVNDQLEAKVLTRSSHSSRTSYAVAADLSEMELKKILIEKMEGNKSIQCSNEQRNLYKALVAAYESDKIILDTYGNTVTLKRRRDDGEDKDEEPSAGPDRGSKRRKEGKEPESASAPSETATRSADRSTKGADDLPIVQSSQHPEWFPQQQKPPTPDYDWNKTLPAVHGIIQPVDTLTPELLAGPTYELMKGSCRQYPHNLLQPLPLIPNNRGRRVIPFEYFINNDLEYLRGGASSRKYTTSITKTKAADYEHIKWIEDLVPRTIWINEPIDYDKHALWGVSYCGRKRQQFYGFAVNRESARNVYSKRRIIDVTELKIVEWHSYKHLDWITMRRDDDKLYTFKEGDFKRLRIQDIKDMLLLLVQGKLTNLTVKERFPFNVSLRMFTRSIVIQRLTHWFTLIALSALRRFDNENALSLMILILRSILTDLQVTPTKPGRMTKPYSSHRFTANYFNAGNFKMEVKVPGSVVSQIHNHMLIPDY